MEYSIKPKSLGERRIIHYPQKRIIGLYVTDMKKKLRIVIDSGMVLLLPLLMAYSLVGEAAHEYLGIGMFLLFISHHILNICFMDGILHFGLWERWLI